MFKKQTWAIPFDEFELRLLKEILSSRLRLTTLEQSTVDKWIDGIEEILLDRSEPKNDSGIGFKP